MLPAAKNNLSLTPDTLLPTEKIIELAKTGGANFGSGNPLERIRYYIKLVIIPHATRKSPNSKKGLAPVGHLPYKTVELLVAIESLKTQGLSYPQIAKKLKAGVQPTLPAEALAEAGPSTTLTESDLEKLQGYQKEQKGLTFKIEVEKKPTQEELIGPRTYTYPIKAVASLAIVAAVSAGLMF